MKKYQWLGYVAAAIIGALAMLPAVYTGRALQEEKHKKELQECANELVKPNKCGKLWQYASTLEDENARLNLRLHTCLKND